MQMNHSVNMNKWLRVESITVLVIGCSVWLVCAWFLCQSYLKSNGIIINSIDLFFNGAMATPFPSLSLQKSLIKHLGLGVTAV